MGLSSKTKKLVLEPSKILSSDKKQHLQHFSLGIPSNIQQKNFNVVKKDFYFSYCKTKPCNFNLTGQIFCNLK